MAIIIFTSIHDNQLSRDIDIGHFGRTPHLLHPALFEIGH
jgi:hypothetical protein